jgi:hypothetical protein
MMHTLRVSSKWQIIAAQSELKSFRVSLNPINLKQEGDRSMLKKMFASATVVILALVLAIGQTNAQTKNPQQKKSEIAPAAGSASTVSGNGTAGQLSKWVGNNTTSYVLGDSIIFEDKYGKVGVGTTTPTSKFTVAGIIETTLGGVKFPDGSVQTTAGLSSVFHDATLTGNGTSSSPLGIANGGVGTAQLANNSVTSSKIAMGAVGTTQLADNAVTSAKIAPGQAVKSINGLTDNLTFAAGSNITITPVGNTLTIASSGSSPATTAFQATLQASWSDNGGGANATLNIPSGKRLVIEYISMTASLDAGDTLVDVFLKSTLDGNQVDFRISVAGNTSFPISPFTHAIDKPVRIYADSLIVSAFRSQGNGGSFSLHISGHLIDLP